MLTLYCTRPSIPSRFVWLTLLEKQLTFELVFMKLDGDQFESDFQALNPFGRVPVLLDNGFRVVESIAILDYLEIKYPTPPLLPIYAEELATVRMVQMLTVNELLPAALGILINQKDQKEVEFSQHRAINSLAFLDDLLADKTYFAGNHLTFAEITAGTLIPLMDSLGISLEKYPRLINWSNRLLSRSSWQQIQLSPKELNDFKRRIRVISKIWQKRRRQRANLH
ncbi:MAG: glutathione S-transferase family protein [Prochloraceae cyanobacterium]